ncbi:tyrosine phosphatase family protein [Methylobacterium sp. A49B]|uniref:Protein tyrosine phosphatase n=1 Tax=Methylobacterium mesophilicum SR1.6/6 TaxID=908290 RepID=A0A6B9FRN7_9HYPH|nr:tyrosine phosphatase family protein [Methylobacterium mesophilicum]QGY04702.1 protein tyrosine phosphatase [Methylobacterium mesophilicum SR1.6/6]
MPTLHVCPLSRLSETVAATGASHVLTLINVGTPLERPAVIDAANHAVIGVSDIATARDGHVLPAEEHVARVLDFVRGWPREKPLVVHCYAGISRSTAAAYIAACALAPERDEDAIADTLRAASPSATPNPLFVAIADRMLGREGRMVAAIARIGRGADAFEGTPFCLTLV